MDPSSPEATHTINYLPGQPETSCTACGRTLEDPLIEMGCPNPRSE